MKRVTLLTSALLICLLIAGTFSQANAQSAYTINLAGGGPTPSAMQVKTGAHIGFKAAKDGDIYGVTVTSAPAGCGMALGTENEELAGCSDYAFTPTIAGTYTFNVVYNFASGASPVSITATSGDTAYAIYSDGGSGATSLNVNVGDFIVFEIGYLKNCADQVYLSLTSVPNGAANPAPAGSGYDIGSSGHGALIYPVTVAGAYSFSIQGTSGFPGYSGTITATSAAAAGVEATPQSAGLTMRVSPEPSNGAATIDLTSDKPVDLHLALFDALGRQVRVYDDVKFGSGDYSLPLSSTSLPSGDYYLRALSGGQVVATAKVVIVR